MTDEEMDYSDIPEIDAAFFETARVVVPPGKNRLRSAWTTMFWRG